MATYENLTYRELKDLVPEARRCKMTAKKLQGEEVLFSEKVHGADITIYKNGFLTYTIIDDNGRPHTTVYSVHRCKQIVFPMSFTKEEREEAWSCPALSNITTYRMIDGHLTKLHIVLEKEYLDGPWWMPICVVCDDRLHHNQESSEEYHAEFSLDGVSETADGDETSEVWNPALAIPDTCEEWLEEQDRIETKKRNHETLLLALQSLTDKQRKCIDLCFYRGMTEREAAKELGVNQSTVNRTMQAAITKMRKFF